MYRFVMLVSVGLLVLASLFYLPRLEKGSAVAIERASWVPEVVSSDGYDDFAKYKFHTKYPIFYFSNDTVRSDILSFLFAPAGSLSKVQGADSMAKLASAFGYSSESAMRSAFKKTPAEFDLYDMARLAGHVRTLNEVKNSGHDWAIVVEDLVSPILVPLWDLSLDDVMDAIVTNANGEGRFVQLAYDFASTEELYRAMEVWRIDPFTRIVRCADCKGTVAYAINQPGIEKLIQSLSRSGVVIPCGPLVDHVNATCDPGILFPVIAEGYHRIRTPPVFTYRYIDAPERKWIDQFQHVADAMQWAAIGEELYNTNMEEFPQYYPYTRWKVNEYAPTS